MDSPNHYTWKRYEKEISDDIDCGDCNVKSVLFQASSVLFCHMEKHRRTWLRQLPEESQGLGREHWNASASIDEIAHPLIRATTPWPTRILCPSANKLCTSNADDILANATVATRSIWAPYSY
jgi:hypothetical protein